MSQSTNLDKMCPAKPVDIFILHTSVGMSVPDAIRHVKPKMTFVVATGFVGLTVPSARRFPATGETDPGRTFLLADFRGFSGLTLFAFPA